MRIIELGMTGDELFRKLNRRGRAIGVGVWIEASPEKGSHGRLWLGDRCTIIKDRRKEIGAGLLRSMLRDLQLTPQDLE